MADSFSVEVRTVAFEAGMQRLKSAVRSGLIDPSYGTLTVQGRLLAERCQAFTPPRNVGQGRAAVARDLTRIFRPISADTFDEAKMKRIVREDRRAAWDAAAKHFNGNLRNTSAIAFDPAYHERNRNRRGKLGNMASTVTLGQEAKKARAYIKHVQNRVGWAKGGWNMGIVGLGGRVSQQWVARHSVSRGFLVDGRSSSDPFIQIGNDTGWAKYNGAEGNRILRNAIAARSRDMQSFVDRAMKRAAQLAEAA